MSSVTGSCLCGGVRFEVAASFESISQCHCATCKKLSGGPGTVNGHAPSAAIRILAGGELVRTYQPAEGSAKTFCANCGSNLFGGGWPESETASVRLSALDSPPAGKPQRHIFMRSVAPWESVPNDGVPRFETRPPG